MNETVERVRLFEIICKRQGGEWERLPGGLPRAAADEQVRFLQACGVEAFALVIVP